jgi:hypothetical protein
MVRPLYPLRNPPGKKAAAPPQPLWKNPHLLGALAVLLVLAGVFVYHVSRSGIIDPEATGPSGTGEGVFAFLKPSRYFSRKPADLQKQYNQQLEKMGIASQSEALAKKVEASDLREQKRIMTMQKYEAARETSARFQQEREELRRRLSSPTSMQLKDAVMALEASDNLGIMKLESLLEEKLHSQGASSDDLAVIVYAYDSLAKVYESKNMPEKAKDAYINVFRLMKRQAPDSQGPDWDNAISSVEQMSVKSRGN